jgi:hypothetical protein
MKGTGAERLSEDCQIRALCRRPSIVCRDSAAWKGQNVGDGPEVPLREIDLYAGRGARGHQAKHDGISERAVQWSGGLA